MDRAATNRRLVWILVLLAFVEGAWFAFDGSRALLTGDYVTPQSGEYAGQLGPWAALVTAVGMDPRSTLMKSIHVGLGLAWLAAGSGVALSRSWGWPAMFASAIASLWYLPIGTLFGAVQMILLFRPSVREQFHSRT